MRALAVAVALLALVLGGCGGEREEAAPPSTAPEASPPATAPDASPPAAPAVEPDRPAAPAIEGVGLDGERLSLASLRGRPVLVNVWSSW